MAATADKLTLADFERQHGDEKPYREYWFGEAVPKATPTLSHGLLQKLMMMALDEAGYESASEVKLKISSDFEPVPDVIATASRFGRPNPTQPMDVAIEILSPEDSFQRVPRKCKLYSSWGIPTVVVLDPDSHEGWIWDRQSDALKETAVIAPEGRYSVSLDLVFRKLNAALERQNSTD